MDQDPSDPKDPALPAKPTSGAGDIDLDKILLPKKEIHSPESAERINAGALLDQELAAGETTPESSVPKEAPTASKNSSIVRPLETYKGDVEELVQTKNVSVVSIAAAEAQRRKKGGQMEEPAVPHYSLRRAVMLVAGAVLVCAALGALGYAALRNAPLPVQAPTQAPFISVDSAQVVTLPAQPTHSAVMQALTSAKNNVQLSLGLVAWLYPTVASTTAGAEAQGLTGPQIIALLAPDVPQELALTIEPTYLLGVHNYASYQPFLILSVDSYEQAYAGMLAWEPTMHSDLSPLFDYTPSPQLAGTATSSATTTAQFLPTPFKDAVVESHDARVIEDSSGTIEFLWTFLDSNTLVITTNEYTLREVISRLSQAPVTPLPGQ